MPHETRLSILERAEERFLDRMERALRKFDLAYGEHHGTRAELRDQFEMIMADPELRSEWVTKARGMGYTQQQIEGYWTREMILALRRSQREQR